MYYLEFRRKIQADLGMLTPVMLGDGIQYSINVDGLVIHYDERKTEYGWGEMGPSFLLDMTPTSIVQNYGSFHNAVLAVGKTFTDPWNGFTITTTALNDNGLEFSVQNLPEGDVTPPRLTITYPANGAEVEGIVPVAAEWFDEKALRQIEFYVDGVLQTGIDPYPMNTCIPSASSVCSSETVGLLQWDARQVRLGTHTLTIKAYDTQNVTSRSITVNVMADEAPRLIHLTSPLAGTTLSGMMPVVGINNFTSINSCCNGTEESFDSDWAHIEVLVDGIHAFGFERRYPSIKNMGAGEFWYQGGNYNFYCSREYPACYWYINNEASGAHTLTLEVTDLGGKTSTQTINVRTP
jgi:hypothetical protein